MLMANVTASNNCVDNQLRTRASFDFNWKFFKEDIAEVWNVAFNDANWESVNLPHDWSIEGPFSEDNPSGDAGGYLPGGIGWYRNHFGCQKIIMCVSGKLLSGLDKTH